MPIALRQCLLAAIAAVGWSAEPIAAHPATAVAITVEAGVRQTFAGFGTSVGNWSGTYQKLAPANRERLSQALWGDLGFTILRMWVNTHEYSSKPGEHALSEFRARFIDSGVLADARRNGVTTLLLAPEGLPPYLAQDKGRGRELSDDAAVAYADLLVDLIVRLRDEAGVTLDATGVQNEPNDKDLFTNEQIAAVVVRMRRGLDAAGLRSVRIIGPETSSCDGVLYDCLEHLQKSDAAWGALGGISSHTYNMGATEQAWRLARGKDYWMTETSDNGPEVPGDAIRAATLASRFLGDANHGVTHWIHFLGFEQDDPRDNATRIFSLRPDGSGWTTFLKYQYYRELSAAFAPGTVLRRCTSSLDGDMAWTYGKKPRLSVACGRRKDGSWSIGLSNFTAPSFSDRGVTGTWDIDQMGRAALTASVTVRIAELADAPDQVLRIARCGPGGTEPVPATAVLHGGTVTIDVAPLELVTVRGQQPAR